ncbi:MAG: AAA family ATPase [Chromatiales bacterium]|nr:AAA family ATPase [Chromatiales bacterium]
MYEEHFRLSCRPFDISPDPRFVYMTAQHSRAIANMRFALLNHDSFVIITGEIGIGKTTIINSVLEGLGEDYVTAKLTHTTLSDIELLQALLSAFGMPNYSKKKVLLLDQLRDFCLDQKEQGRHVVIIVDEAQNLSETALEELRLLSCIDTTERRIISIVLTGQPGLNDLLDSPGLMQLRQRARLRQHLDALNEDETTDYINHRLEIAGRNAAELFEPGVPGEIHRLTFGIPRLINTLCDTALTACMVDEKDKVDLDMIDSVVQELRWTWFEDRRQTRQPTGRGDAGDDSTGARITLMVHRGGELVDQLEADRFPLVIGRSNANDLVLIDKEVSRRHALIDCIGGIFVVEDLNSRNGILVNQKRRARALLRSGDVITFGLMEVVFHADASQVPKFQRTASLRPTLAVGDSIDDTGRQTQLVEPGSETIVSSKPGS